MNLPLIKTYIQYEKKEKKKNKSKMTDNNIMCLTFLLTKSPYSLYNYSCINRTSFMIHIIQLIIQLCSIH